MLEVRLLEDLERMVRGHRLKKVKGWNESANGFLGK